MTHIRFLDFKGSFEDLSHTATSHYDIDVDEVQKRLNKVIRAEFKAMGFVLPKGSVKESPIYDLVIQVRL